MKKLLIILPIISLVIVGCYLQFNQNNLTSSSVTIKEWKQCKMNRFVRLLQPCEKEQDFSNTANKLDSYFYGEGISDCQQFYLFQMRGEDQPLNQNGYYEKCYLSAKAKQIANSNSCFMTNQYKPFYLECAGL